ncbi:MAG TPA: hypothetical protein PKY59_11840 [Pyrinomonadaceae bacterium]|nr:hypothetical protein [Pyrinomonadaceae bacterium]
MFLSFSPKLAWAKMLFLFIILTILSAVITISLLSKSRKTLRSSEIKEIQEPPPYRSLFEPDEEEIRALEREERTRLKALEEQKREDLLVWKKERVYEFQKIWGETSNVKNTLELLMLASSSENGNLFSEIAEKVIEFWKEDRIKNLSAKDLADLLDSHFRTLPQQERTSGAMFRLKEEIAELRTKSEAHTDVFTKTSDNSVK